MGAYNEVDGSGLNGRLYISGAAIPAAAQQAAQAAPTVAAASPEAKALSLRYLKAIEFENLLITGMGPMLDAFAAQQPELSEDERLLVRGVVLDSMKAIMPAYLEEVANLYAGALTVEELQASVDFYEAPLGRSVTAKSLTLTSQSQAMFERFQPMLNAEIMKRMEAIAAAEE